MNPQDVIRWQSGFHAARQAEQKLLRQEGVNCQRSIRLALSLIDAYCKGQHAIPSNLHNRMWNRDVSRVRESWVRLKKVYAR